MATIKSYLDLEQSKKLAEILPVESADMWYNISIVDKFRMDGYEKLPCFENVSDVDIPCWSLAALLTILESEIDGKDGEIYQLNIEKDSTWWNVWYSKQGVISRYNEENIIKTESTEELINACMEMILKLHEQNIL